MFKTITGALAATAMLAFSSAGLAQESPLVWTFSTQSTAGGGTASLDFAVPETDNVQVSATCGGDVPSGRSSFILAADFGDQPHATQTKVRFSGGGKEYEIEGKVERPNSEEGLFGVNLDIPNDDPVWDAFNSNDRLEYQVPGYATNALELATGKVAIRNFVNACRTIASGGATTSAAAPSNNISEREAFQFARELDSIPAWEAFLKVYPSGFFSELGRAYLAKLQDGGATPTPNQPATPAQPATPQLAFANPGPATTPWFNSNYEQDEGNAKSYAANVIANGAEFVTWCGANKRMQAVIRESGRGIYPRFDDRMQQGTDANPNFTITFSSGETHRVPVVVFGLTGEVGINRDFSASDAFYQAMMRDNTMTVQGNPFGATFQLKGSRKAICNVINRCGVSAPGCAKKVVVRPKPSTNNAGRCRSRSTWIEGRGCVLKSSLNKKPRSGCPRGQVRFDGRCMRPSEKRGYCGPGYRPKGNRCVSQAAQQKVPMLKRNEGGLIPLALCLAQGMIPEFGYCVEND